MPLAKFNRDSVQTGPEIPRLRLEKDEKARIVVLDEGPQYRWQHRMAKVALIGQRPKMVTKERQNGETYEVYDMDYVGSPACTGDIDVLEERGVDPDGCIVCAASRKYPDAISEPQRRFSMHVFKYQTKPGTSEIQVPFGGQLLVWSFTEKRFSVLVDIAEEFGDLRTTDLVLGPCSNKQFQNFEIHGSPKAAWLATDETKAYTAAVYRENKFTDAELMDMCAKLKDTRYVKEDIEAVVERWEYVAQWEAGTAGMVAPGADLSVETPEPVQIGDALADLFDTPADQVVASEAKDEPVSRVTTSPTDDLEALLASSNAVPEDNAAPEPAPAPAGETIAGVVDLDDLLS